ncbi:MAG: hypothetical protein LBC56_05185 [Oscillospiraceae bacterium]|nr:hypothetical protein [Oscillospiraceae bacterium]
MYEKKPISIDEYRRRPYIDAKLSEILDNMDEDELPEELDSDFFDRLFERSRTILDEESGRNNRYY